MRVLVVNAGSSSLKLTLLEAHDETLAQADFPAPDAGIDQRELREALEPGFGQADVVGHRIVHGGERFHGAVVIDDRVEDELRELVTLAPLHQPKSLAGIDLIRSALPGLTEIACFDTGFHSYLPPAARTYALPRAWRERWHVRRYGFHGLSHAWIARRVPELLRRPANGLRLVSCHLGAGASLCAIVDGRSVDTTMGFTPLEGLVMATRSGSVDPGLLFWLLEQTGLSERQLALALEYDGGLKGLSGTGDMRQVLTRAAADDDAARLALDVYLHRLRAGIAAMAASLGGIDALAFTGGVGENSPQIRAETIEALGFLGLALDPTSNQSAAGDCEISAAGAQTRAVVVRAREDLEIAGQCRALLVP